MSIFKAKYERNHMVFGEKLTLWGNRISRHRHWCLKNQNKTEQQTSTKKNPNISTFKVSDITPKLKAVIFNCWSQEILLKTELLLPPQENALPYRLSFLFFLSPPPLTSIQVSCLLINDKTSTLIISDRLTPYLM